MIETTIIPRPVRALTEDEKRAQLAAQRAKAVLRLKHATEQKRYWAGRNNDEMRAWANHERSLLIDIEMIDGDIAHYATPPDERYAELRAQMRHEDRTCNVAESATNWEDA